METYIIICKIDSQQEFSIWLRKLKQGLCINLKGGMGREMGRSFKKEGIYVYLCQTLFFWAPKSLWMVTAAMKLKEANSLEGKL